MNTSIMVGLAGTLMVNRGIGISEEVTSPPSIECHRITKPPIIDGKLDDAAWKEAAYIPRFNAPLDRGQGQITEQTSAYLGYDDSYLFIAFRCYDSEIEKLKVSETKRDGSLWTDDSVEIFLDVNHDHNTYYHFIVNAKGIQLDEKVMDVFWDADWKASTSIYKDGWNAEVAIPFGALEITEDVGSTWGINLNRGYPRKEYSSWAETIGTFHHPKAFGDLIGINLDFSKFLYRVRLSLPQEQRFGENVLCALVQNIGDSPRPLIAKLEITSPSGRKHIESSNLTVPRHGEKEVKLVYELKETGRHQLVLIMTSAETQQIHYVSPIHFLEVPPGFITALEEPWYRNSVYSSHGMKEAVISIRINLPNKKRNEMSILGQIQSLRTQKILDTKRIDALSSEEFNLKFDVTGLSIGDYLIKIDFVNRSGKKIDSYRHTFHVLPKAENEVTVGRDNTLFVNGKPFFPIGIFHVRQEKELFVAREHGFNVVIPASVPGKEYFDTAEKLGLKVIPECHLGTANVVDSIKNYPALLAYYSFDEPAGEKLILARDIYENILTKLDPYHPVMTAVCSPGAFSEVIQTVDILAPDPYPVRIRPITMVSDFMDGAVKATEGKKPVWAVIQAHSYPRGSLSLPTAEEARCMTYMALVHGARGILYLGYSADCIGAPGSEAAPQSPQLWLEIKKLNSEIRQLTPIILSDTISEEVSSVPQWAQIHFVLKKHDDNKFLFAVNTEPEPQEITFYFSTGALSNRRIEVLFEDRKIEEVTGESFLDTFGPYGVHIYQIK